MTESIDYNQPITRDNIDLDSYNEKFIKVDAWLASNKRDNIEYGSFLLDPTTFAYLHQRVDNKPLKYYPYQDLIANDPHRFKFFRAANQIGKSLLLDSRAAKDLIWDHGYGHNRGLVSRSLPLSGHQMRRIKSLLRTMPEISWKDIKGESDSMSVISVDIKEDIVDDKGIATGKQRIKYTNYLICAPCTEGLLSYDFHELDLDEFEFWDVDHQYFFNQIAKPRTYHTKGNITIFSNPNGANHYGAELEAQVLRNGNKKWHLYVFNYLDCPGNTEEDLESEKIGLNRAQVESTLMAIRSLSDRNYFTSDEIANSHDAKVREIDMIGKQSFWFLDVGAKKDQSVLCGGYTEPDEHNELLKHIYIPIIVPYPVGYPLSRVVGSNTAGDDGWHYVKSVKEHLAEYAIKDNEGKIVSLPPFGVDVTGNSGISPLFETVGIYPTDVTFSGPVKSGMYQRLKYFMEKGLIHRVKSKEFDYQFSHLEMRKSARGYLLIHHENEDDLDDIPDSIAGLVHLADGPAIKSTVEVIRAKKVNR